MQNRIREAFEDFWESLAAKTPDILVGLILFVIFLVIAHLVRKLIRTRLGRRAQDPLLVNFIARIFFLVILVLGIILFLGQVGLTQVAGSLLAGAGVGALILGFAFKDIGENFIAGFFLAVSRPFSIGDIVEIESYTGKVKSLDFRNTHIRTFDGRDIFVPNATLVKNTLTNFTRDGLMRHDFVVGIDYEDETTEAIRIILEEMDTLTDIVKTTNLQPFVIVNNFGVSTVDLRIFFWINTHDFLGSVTVLKSHVMEAVFRRLKQEGFTLPANIVELKIYQEGRPIPIKVRKDDFRDTESPES